MPNLKSRSFAEPFPSVGISRASPIPFPRETATALIESGTIERSRASVRKQIASSERAHRECDHLPSESVMPEECLTGSALAFDRSVVVHDRERLSNDDRLDAGTEYAAGLVGDRHTVVGRRRACRGKGRDRGDQQEDGGGKSLRRKSESFQEVPPLLSCSPWLLLSQNRTQISKCAALRRATPCLRIDFPLLAML